MRWTAKLAGAAWWLVPAAVGTALRVYHLPAQILAGDELHAVRVALQLPLREALTTYQVRDNCLPLTGIDRFLLDRGVGLTETVVRLPVLLCGLLALLVIPGLAARRCGRPLGRLLAWLVALAPVLVFYSRIARPYAPVVLLSFGAAMAFERWWRTGRRGSAVAYCLLAALSAYFHIITTPLVLAPLLYGLGSLVLSWRERRDASPPAATAAAPAAPGSLGSAGSENGTPAPTTLTPDRGAPPVRPGLGGLAAVAAGTAAAFLVFLAPAWESLRAVVADKQQQLEILPATVRGVLELQAGSAHPVAAVLFWIAAAAGLVRLLRTDRALGIYTALLVGCQVAGLLILSPEMMIHPLVFDRYLMVTLPWVLLWAAAGLSALWPAWRSAPFASLPRSVPPDPARSGHWRPAACRVLVVAAVAAWAASGPLADPALAHSSFTGHNDFVGFFCPRAHLPPARVPAFYRTVLARQRDAPVLEYPWFPWWAYTQAYYVYQEVHRQEVVVGSVSPLRHQQELRFRNMALEASPDGILATRARYLAVHLDLVAEQQRITPHCWSAVPGEMQPRARRALTRGGRELARGLLAAWGPPDHEDSDILVWDLDRIRRGISQTPPM